MSAGPIPRRPAVAGSVGAVIVAAWAALFAWGTTPHAKFLRHTGLDAGAWSVPVVTLGWTLMILAMMLPTSLPLVDMFRRMTQSRDDRDRLLIRLVAGYLLVWAAFGAAVHAGDLVLHRLIDGRVRAEVPVAVVLGFAGLYQFSSLKYRCLAKCRSPRMFIAGHWRGRDPAREALALGAHHGAYCLGCCWALMLVMFAVGAGNVGWMLGLGAVMAIEKNVSWGRRLSAPAGAALLAGAAVVAFV